MQFPHSTIDKVVLELTMSEVFLKKKSWLPNLFAVLASIYLAYIVVSPFLFTKFEHQQSDFQALPEQTTSEPETVEGKKKDFLEISHWHLLGQADLSSVPGGQLPETQLQLKLQGLLTVGKQNKQAHAIITSADQAQKTYKINDELPGGGTLHKIETDKVIILRDNQQETLTLERQKLE
jgi:general secretion pathway protein C